MCIAFLDNAQNSFAMVIKLIFNGVSVNLELFVLRKVDCFGYFCTTNYLKFTGFKLQPFYYFSWFCESGIWTWPRRSGISCHIFIHFSALAGVCLFAIPPSSCGLSSSVGRFLFNKSCQGLPRHKSRKGQALLRFRPRKGTVPLLLALRY